MLFRRRNRQSNIQRLRVAVWPRHSWLRSTRYYSKRVLRLSATPHAIAIGFAVGAFTSFTPLLGFHFLISFAIAYILGGNIIAAALGTSVGNPITFPFIWASTFKLGNFILEGKHRHIEEELSDPFHPHILNQSFDTFFPVIKPMLVGAVPLGLITGVISYFIVWKSVEVYQRQRRHSLAQKREQSPLRNRQDHDLA
ncbi:MAG: DUF2062 domain-containing protein [Rhodobacteraceae bacterium]|nr:DUF2062 domain-containing protein [Paracoccaceae bacterium]